MTCWSWASSRQDKRTPVSGEPVSSRERARVQMPNLTGHVEENEAAWNGARLTRV